MGSHDRERDRHGGIVRVKRQRPPQQRRLSSAPPAKGAAAPGAANTRAFATPKQWAAWLAKHHATSKEVWIRFFKKKSGVRSITYAEAVDEALCWGWIDGQSRPGDERSWLQRWTPRRARSVWSRRNRDRAIELEKDGRMQPPGRRELEAARADGRWQQAYDSAADSRIPEDFLQAVSRNKKALAFFRSLNRANLYAISYRLQTAKNPETRQRRFDRFLTMMKEGKRFY